jgi:cell division protein FtsW (lipid II flippase)
MYNFLKGRLLFVRLCLLTAVLILIGIGIATIYSVGNPAEHSPDSQAEDLSNKWEKQVVFAIVGLAGFIVINSINYRRFGTISYWIFAGVLVLLVMLLFSKYVVVLPFAKPINGTYRWIWFSI